jgi:F-type H+-transporting ATPase subunit b
MHLLNEALSMTILAEAAHPAGEASEGLLTSLGLSWGKFLAQVLLFLIVYTVLKKYAFGPIQQVLAERAQRIADGEEKLKQIEKDRAAADANAQEVIDGANNKADRLIAEARESAEAVGEKKRQDATTEAAQIIAKAREASELERDQRLAELRRDFGRLVVDTTSKVTGKVLSSDDQEKINKETAAQVAL